MTIQIENSPIKKDLGLIAIEAAEDIERFRQGLPTKFKSLNYLSSILKDTFDWEIVDAEQSYRLDYVSLLSSTFSNLSHPTYVDHSMSDIVKQARTVASQLTPNYIKKNKNKINDLISFCVALSECAAIYKEELKEMNSEFV